MTLCGGVRTCWASSWPHQLFLLLLPPDNSIQSVITFDRGGEWVPLRKPKNTTCDSTARSKEEVGLSPPGGDGLGAVPLGILHLGSAKGMLGSERIHPAAPTSDAKGVGPAVHGLWVAPWGCMASPEQAGGWFYGSLPSIHQELMGESAPSVPCPHGLLDGLSSCACSAASTSTPPTASPRS